MIPSRKVILFWVASIFHFLLFTNLSLSLPNSAANPSNPFIPSNPMPTKRNFSSLLSDPPDPFQPPSLMQSKKLRRLPHVFGKVLELPLNSEADVSVEERPDCFRFAAEFDCLDGGDVKALVVEVHPGVKKVVVRGGAGVGGGGLLIDELKLDVWRFRLPATARPEAAKVMCRGRQLLVTVPKICGGGGGVIGKGNMGNLLAVV